MIVVVGAGVSGAVIADRYARELNQKVIVLEKRLHIGGNCYDFYNDDGLLIPLYGPHFFHTNEKSVWDYLNRFSEWDTYEHKVLSYVDGKLVPIPVNIETVNTLFNETIATESEMISWLKNNCEKIENPINSEESAISRVGKVLYKKMFKNYTKKQWDLYPAELDAAVMNRIPVRTNFEERYFSDTYQAMPRKGYTTLFQNMLDHPNIEVRLNTDFFHVKDDLPKWDKLFFSGRIDDYFNEEQLERLQYRSLNFSFETLDQEQFQSVATVNYPNDMEFTRITEPKISTGQKSCKTTIIKEFPTWEGDPYYPVLNKKNSDIYSSYHKMALKEMNKSVYFIGRLANYKYFNMDQAFLHALNLFESVESKERILV